MKVVLVGIHPPPPPAPRPPPPPPPPKTHPPPPPPPFCCEGIDGHLSANNSLMACEGPAKDCQSSRTAPDCYGKDRRHRLMWLFLYPATPPARWGFFMYYFSVTSRPRRLRRREALHLRRLVAMMFRCRSCLGKPYDETPRSTPEARHAVGSLDAAKVCGD